MTYLTVAERLLQTLGVTEPREIDLEAIAFFVGARIRYRQLEGCEARIIGYNETAIITVNSRSSLRRKRFSVAHELGHWQHHRGRCLVCRAEESLPGGLLDPERIANGYAADLLMPNYLFGPMVRQQAKITLATASVLADAFETSLQATAIRLVQGDHTPAILVCHGPNGRKWFARAPSVPKKWFPRDSLDAESSAFEVQFGGKPNSPVPQLIGADAWFDRWEAEKFGVLEQTWRTGSDETLTLLTIRDQKMLDDP